ncbi:MAG TPA: ABC transporter [Bacteroidales bacterium]|nr:ABC transporter [Bacteroidales bacterium]HBZ19775.1 ABC transporter [Bacteroidales bacterium]
MIKDTPILTANSICKSFGGKAVLKGINIELFRGKFYGLVGENGSGKTTMLNILAGFWKANTGTVEINCRTGFCPQEPYLFSNLTVAENITLFSLAYGLNRKEYLQKYEEHRKILLETFNLKGYEKSICSKLSEGTRQKLNLVISLLHDPDLLLLDEPYSSLDWDTYLRFWDYSGKLKQKGKTLLIVSHFIYDKSRMDKIWELSNGDLL